jgi:hypothetical protein
VEGSQFFPIRLPVGQLILDLLYAALPPLTEPGRELGGAILAQIAVGQLAIPEQSDLSAANTAEFLVKQSHNKPPLFYI